MTGKIIKGIAGFYYVHDGKETVYQCKAKGIFRNRKIKPLVGDNVEFSVLDPVDKEGNITGETYSGSRSFEDWKSIVEKELEGAVQ